MTLKQDISALLTTPLSDSVKLRLIKVLTDAATDETPLADWELALLYDKGHEVEALACEQFRALQAELEIVTRNTTDSRARGAVAYVATRVADHRKYFERKAQKAF
jgi:hypothetical protein